MPAACLLQTALCAEIFEIQQLEQNNSTWVPGAQLRSLLDETLLTPLFTCLSLYHFLCVDIPLFICFNNSFISLSCNVLYLSSFWSLLLHLCLHLSLPLYIALSVCLLYLPLFQSVFALQSTYLNILTFFSSSLYITRSLFVPISVFVGQSWSDTHEWAAIVIQTLRISSHVKWNSWGVCVAT